MGKSTAAVAVLILLVPLLVILIATAGGACDPASGGGGGSDSETGHNVDPDDIPVDNVGPYGKEQLRIAALIMNAAADADLSERAQVLGVMAGIGESTLTNIEHGDGAGPDSRGVFQQRAQGWGTLEERMDPYTAARGFFGVGDHADAPGLVDIDGWEDMEPTLAINKVQRNADPYYYEEFEDVARDIVDALQDVPLAQGSGSQQVTLHAAGRDTLSAPDSVSTTAQGNYDESIYDQLEKSLGPVKPHVLEATTVIATVTDHSPGDIGGYREGGSRDPNGHPAGLAVDFMVPLTDEGKSAGDAIAQYAIDNAEHLNVKYVIWYQRIYNVDRPDEGWRDMEDRGSDTQNHLDHPHISFEQEATGDPRDADDAPSLPDGGGGGQPPECEEDGGGGNVPPGENEPGPWGGHENGRIPDDALKTIPWASDESLRADAVDQLIEMNNAFRDEFGTDLGITDAYRTYAEQEYLYETKPDGMAAKPGTSNHGWALAVDFGTGINQFGTPQHEWMRENAGRYGWKHPDWAQQGQKNAEAWHWEFYGVKE